jgi:NADPH:quinone reductase-like Zn-dependent oxidoreductase/predicted TIM-barrel fold metal-dependent hydrolase
MSQVGGEVGTASEKKSAREYLAGVKVVDTDTHITEWPDLWTSRATPKFKDRVPQVKIVDGQPSWMIDQHKLAGDSGFSAIKKDGSKAPGLEFFNLRYEDVHLGAHDVRARVGYMDQEGIAAQIGYTNLLGFVAPKASQVDAELRLVSVQILNDALAEMQAESRNRVYPMAMLPWWDIKLAVAEAERCANMGLRGVNTHSAPQTHGMADLGDPYWAPLWEVCEGRDLPVNFHIGFSDGTAGWFGSSLWKSHSDYTNFTASSVMLFGGNMHVIVNLLLSKVFQRHPKLHFVSVESGLGWVPYMLEVLEYQMAEGRAGHESNESIIDPGAEVAGDIEVIGSDVSGFAVGERVIAMPGWGGMAEKVVAKASRCVPMPAGMSFEEGACFLLTYATALYALRNHGQVGDGNTVLILGAAGGVGFAGLQVAKALGARVVCGVSSEKKAALVKSAGADEVVVYPSAALEKTQAKMLTEQFKKASGEEGYSHILDNVGGAYTEAAVRAVGFGGRVLVIGFPAGIPKLPLNLVLLKSCQVVGVFFGAFSDRDPGGAREIFTELNQMFANGLLKPHISARFPLTRGGEAISMLKTRRALGKVVVTIDG